MPLLKSAGLWAKTSAKGNRYLVGQLGGIKVLILENKDRDRSEGDPTHWLLFIEASPKADAQQQPRPPALDMRNGAAGNRATPARPGAGDPRPFDDDLSDLYAGGA